MEKQLAKIVNKGMAGEPENVVLQVIDTLKIIEFSQIKHVDEGGVIGDITLIDNTLDQFEIQHILNNMGHAVEISFDENDNVTLYF
jgi:predicted transcriptional regulator